MRIWWRKTLKTWCLSVVVTLGMLAGCVGLVYAQTEHDKVIIKIYEDDPDARTTSFNLATKEIHIEPKTGYVEILRGETTLEAREVSYRQKDQQAILRRNVKAYQPDVDLTADTLTAVFGDNIYIAEGHVHLVQYNTEDQGQRAGEKLNLNAQRVTIDNNKDTVHAQGQVYVEESSRKIWADTMDYSQTEDLMVLTGSVRIETEDGNKLTGNRIVIDMAVDEATVFGPVEAEFIIDTQNSADEGQKSAEQ